jgi:hypothetical protein
MTILDFPLARRTARPSVPIAHIGLARVLPMPAHTSRGPLDAGLESAVDAISMLLMQVDGLTRHTAVSGADLAGYTGQVEAYAFALGVIVHPDSPQQAVQVKRTILGALAVGPLDSDDIRELAMPDLLPPDDVG